MIPELGKHAATVLTAYGASLVLLFGLVAVTLYQSQRAKSLLSEQEAQHNEDI